MGGGPGDIDEKLDKATTILRKFGYEGPLMDFFGALTSGLKVQSQDWKASLLAYVIYLGRVIKAVDELHGINEAIKRTVVPYTIGPLVTQGRQLCEAIRRGGCPDFIGAIMESQTYVWDHISQLCASGLDPTQLITAARCEITALELGSVILHEKFGQQ